MNKQCIICFENSNDNDNDNDNDIIYTIKEFTIIHPLLKSCECLYCIHEKCIITWIKSNPVCPYCKQKLYLEHNLETYIDMDQDQDEKHVNQNQNDNNIIIFDPTIDSERKNRICIRHLLLFCCGILMIIIINNIFMD